MMPRIPHDYLTKVCKTGRGAECCRYIVAGEGGITCAKHDDLLFDQINRRVEAGVFTAQGDNCEGLI